MKHFVYVAGPYTKGDLSVNVANAITAGENLSRLGFIPYIPHLTHYWHLAYPHKIDFWYEYDMQWLERCDCLLRIPGDSVGADREAHRMLKLGRPCFSDIDSLEKWFRGKEY